jgi:hypothetical protein
MKPLPNFYTVRCTKPIAEEMARYEGSKIVFTGYPEYKKGTLDKDYNIDPETDRIFTIYMFHMQGFPNKRRWASFGVTEIGERK